MLVFRSMSRRLWSIGGPSAGLAFTLTLIDMLTPGELTGGNRVAVTGTISAAGDVGNVGGVAQKAAVAEAEGVAMFIVPKELVDAAESTTDDLRVVGVESLDDALAALAELGGDVEELASPCQALPLTERSIARMPQRRPAPLLRSCHGRFLARDPSELEQTSFEQVRRVRPGCGCSGCCNE